MTFTEFLSEEVRQFGGVNLLFESGMFALAGSLERIAAVFRAANVPFEVIGGVAVNAHLAKHNRAAQFVTRDIDLLINRVDLERLIAVAERSGYIAKKMFGVYAFLLPNQELGDAVHVLFVGEKTKSTQVVPHPHLRPESLELFGLTVPVIPLSDLVEMKLTSFRAKDQVQIHILDDLHLITAQMEEALAPLFRERLNQARTQHEAEKPDVE